MSDEPFRILVICTGNRARSQMAHGWLRHLGGERVEVESAGTAPKGVHPVAIKVMAEVGIDISAHTSDHVDDYLDDDFDLVVTVCDQAKDACPTFPGAKQTLHQAFEDPDYPWLDDEEFAAVFRRIRDAVGAFSRDLLACELGSTHRDNGP
ncbi:MAG: arsenate reductase ArsC [Gammaproteobacteria bacterium]|nr:arsenate reductase ArsC [Gammaproteobacteria bacterium]MDE0442061.1 arsenate reductase ArsC [Gammaproteobacteria bacterium]